MFTRDRILLLLDFPFAFPVLGWCPVYCFIGVPTRTGGEPDMCQRNKGTPLVASGTCPPWFLWEMAESWGGPPLEVSPCVVALPFFLNYFWFFGLFWFVCFWGLVNCFSLTFESLLGKAIRPTVCFCGSWCFWGFWL